MDFSELHSFSVLADRLHFGKAAGQLNMSPSALSRMITRLEEELNTSLLDRNNKQISLTNDGRVFVAFARETLAREEDMRCSLSRENGHISGTLSVYASVTACYTILPSFVKQLSDQYPDIHLSVETGDPAEALNALRSGRASLVVAAIPDEGLAGLETVSVKKTPLVFAASQDGPYTRIYGSPQDIVSTVPLILPKAGLARRRFDRWIKSRNVKPVIAAETEGNEAILAIAQLGLGIGLVPELVLQNGPYRDKFVIHAAGNALGDYDIGFIRKDVPSGTKTAQRLYAAVGDILLQRQFQ